MKRVLYILGVLTVSLLLVGGMLVAALTSDRVGTAAVHLATAELSRALGTEARIGAIEYRFPARLAIRDIYLEDRQGDTLGYVGLLYAHFSPLALQRGEIRFSHVRLEDVVADIHRQPDSTWNYAFLMPLFKTNKEKDDSPFKSIVKVKDVQLDNLRLRYEDLVVRLPHAAMDLHELSAGRLDAQISELQAQVTRYAAQNGTLPPLDVKSLKAHMVATDSLVAFPTLTAKLQNSHLDLSGIEINTSAAERENIRVVMQMDGTLTPSDISLFVPRLAKFKRTVDMKGRLSGTVDSLSFADIVVRYNNRELLRGDVAAVGLPDLKNPYLRANLQEFQTNGAQLQDFLSQLYGRPVRLPAAVHRLGTIHYRGLAEGRLHDLTLHGAFRTALGAVSTDGSFRSDSLFNHMDYDARVVGRNFRVGRLIAVPELASMTWDVSSNGQIDGQGVEGDVVAHVRQLKYRDYTYNDLHINGHYAPQRYRGRLHINDRHAKVSFDGVVDLRDENPEINFNLLCRHFDMEPLLPESASPNVKLRTSFAMAVDMNGSEADEISGYLKIDSLFLASPKDSLKMQQLLLMVSATPDHWKAITLNSDYLYATANGTFRYADIVPAFRHMIAQRLPSAVDEPKKGWEPVSFDFHAKGDKLSEIQNLFESTFWLSDQPSLDVKTRIDHRNRNDLNIRVDVPELEVGGTAMRNLAVRMSNATDSVLSLRVNAETLEAQANIQAFAYRDTLLTRIAFSGQAGQEEQPEPAPGDFKAIQRAMVAEQRAGTYAGDLSSITHFTKYNRRPLIELHILPAQLTLRDSVYTIDESRLTYCAADTSLTVDDFFFEGAGQGLRADGVASKRATDTISIAMRRIDASYVVPFVLPKKTIMFNGFLTGEADVTSLFRRPQIDTKIFIEQMGLNDCLFGDAEVDLHITDSLAFHADVYKPHREEKDILVALDGKALFDGSGAWNLDMTTDSVPLAFVNHWTKTVLTDLDGTATGRVVVGGDKKVGVYVLVRAEAQNAHLTLPWTGARYTIPADTIVLDTTAIIFPQVHLADAEGHPVYLDGAIYHNQFRDFMLDLHVDADKALVFDKDKPGEMLRGHVYASGHVDVTGPDKDITVFANAETARSSSFRLSIDHASDAYESSFVHFVEHKTDSLNVSHKGKKEEEEPPAPPAKCKVKLNLDINPMLLFQLVIGERNGDIIQGRGTGALQLTYDTSTGDVSLLGTYDISSGTLSYTVGNVIRKEFTVGSGSTISFSGDAANPQMDVTAKYRVVASLRDLFGEDVDQLTTSRTTIPVLTCLHMSGPLNNPILRFSLEFPASDQSVQQQVQQVINTDEMLMRQVVYLLVFGRFFTPDYMGNAQYATLNSTYSLLSSTVTSQINAWLSKLTTMLTLGVAVRTEGEGAAASQEYEAQFQLQPIDRLVINGNVGYRYNDISNQPFFGDLDVEVLLTEDGQWRLKGYTHTVDKYSLRQATTIQGVGVMWKKDFNWPTSKKNRQKQEEKVIIRDEQ